MLHSSASFLTGESASIIFPSFIIHLPAGSYAVPSKVLYSSMIVATPVNDESDTSQTDHGSQAEMAKTLTISRRATHQLIPHYRTEHASST